VEIAHAAVRLFMAKGVAATSAEEIAEAAGISTRTLWRYFPTKESCVWPLLAAGIEDFAARLRVWGEGGGLVDHVGAAGRASGEADQDSALVLSLVRLTRTEPGLRAVWLQAHLEAERVFAEIIAARTGKPPGGLETKVRAAMLNAALRTAVEHHAWHVTTTADTLESGPGDTAALEATVRAALTTALDGLAGQ
jgi:AcrR family transcriptional regulator